MRSSRLRKAWRLRISGEEDDVIVMIDVEDGMANSWSKVWYK